ncbi:MAG: peptidylprolyl isomerase [Pseudomonadota bacterium]|nr:peptidylprolyl isomerase [Pseudomonadota bacterium]
MMNRIFAAGLLFAAALPVLAQTSVRTAAQDLDVVLAQNAVAKLTVRDYRTELLNLPAEMRDAFATDPKRIATLLNNLLALKTLAAQARQSGLDREPEAQQRLALESERVLAQMQVQRMEEKLGAEFDAKLPELTSRAREMYLVDRAKYTTPAQIDVSHILFAKSRGDEAALKAAREARAKLAAGADFATVARESTDDAGSKGSGGRVGWRAESQLDPDFAKAAFALKKDGEVSEPVVSSFGYHVIRREGYRPAREQSFDEVKPQILADLRAQYITEHRDAALNALRTDPSIKPNQAAIDALVQRSSAAAAPSK